MMNILMKGFVTVMSAAMITTGTMAVKTGEDDEIRIEQEAPENTTGQETSEETTEQETSEETSGQKVPEEFIWGEMNPYDYEWANVDFYTPERWYFYQCVQGQTWKVLVKENPDELSVIEYYGEELVVLDNMYVLYSATDGYVSVDDVVINHGDYELYDLRWF